MRKIYVIFAALLAVILLTDCTTAAAEQEARQMETAADADEFIAAFLGKHPETTEDTWAFSAQMEAAIRQMGGIAGLAKQLAVLGVPETIGPAREEEVQGLKAFFIPCAFSLMPADIILTIQNGEIAGIVTGPYSGTKEEKAGSDAYDSVDLALPVPALGELPGTLTVPKGDGSFPAVVLIHGSGASDRDETAGSLKPFRDIAEGLAERGIAVYRFDKRTYVYAAQLQQEKRISLMEESVDDAVNAVQLLAAQNRIDPDRIFVIGHSMGGNAVPAIARELQKAPARARGFVMMAASPRPLDVLMREQYDFLCSLLPEITAEQQAEKDLLFAELDKLQELETLTDDDSVAGVPSFYWKWLADYDVPGTAEKITEPVLLLQGEEDYQVTMEDFAIWQERFGEKENWTLISYPGLTHAFTSGLKTEGSTVYARTAKVHEDVIADIAAFVLGN